jgi:uncharacterized coiled-coil DUF342 family protein
VKAIEEFETATTTDEFHALEEKIYRTIEQLKAAREAKTAAERATARLREQLNGHDDQVQGLRAEIVALKREREEVRTRVEKMLKQIESLTHDESEA